MGTILESKDPNNRDFTIIVMVFGPESPSIWVLGPLRRGSKVDSSSWVPYIANVKTLTGLLASNFGNLSNLHDTLLHILRGVRLGVSGVALAMWCVWSCV